MWECWKMLEILFSTAFNVSTFGKQGDTSPYKKHSKGHTLKERNELEILRENILEKIAFLNDLTTDILDELQTFEAEVKQLTDTTHKTMPNMFLPICNKEWEKVLEKEVETGLEVQEVLIPVYKLRYNQDK